MLFEKMAHCTTRSQSLKYKFSLFCYDNFQITRLFIITALENEKSDSVYQRFVVEQQGYYCHIHKIGICIHPFLLLVTYYYFRFYTLYI